MGSVVVLADNIISPLGFTSGANYDGVKAGRTAIRHYERHWNITTPFNAALTNRASVKNECQQEGIEGAYTYFELLAILSVEKALKQCDVDASSPRTLFVISTTKANIDLLRVNPLRLPSARQHPGEAALAITRYFSNGNRPLVVSNACISGLQAQLTALRLLRAGDYDHIIVCGAEEQSPFIVSGFQSLKALSDENCRPFDIERNGINLGEAAATIIYGRRDSADGYWCAVEGAVRNDAYHISNPSPVAEGSYECLQYVSQWMEEGEPAFINAHGTATLYNDEMEAKAIDRTGQGGIPVNSLKGYFGHTMGAAGILETVISMHAADDHTILGTLGYESRGTSRKLNITPDNRHTDRKSFIKLISGFGGCNGAMLFRKKEKVK